MLADGYELVLDLDRSLGSTLVDARDGARVPRPVHLLRVVGARDEPSGADHRRTSLEELGHIAVNKPSNSDIYTVPMARFVETFARVLGDPNLPHLFFIDGGALAVENALKIAFDWKSRWNEAHGIDPALGTKVLHLQKAFHGRSGYTMSLTNTDPNKVARFPKFDWPRIPAPSINGTDDVAAAERDALAAARQAFEAEPARHRLLHHGADPGRGRRQPLPPEFLQAMQALCREFDALFIMDEVQTGVGMTGTAWVYQQLGVRARRRRVRQEGAGVRRDGRRPRRRGSPTTCSWSVRGSTRRGAATSPTWCGPAASSKSSRADELIARAADFLGAHLLHSLQDAGREARRHRRRAWPRTDVRVHAAVGASCATR